MLRNQHTHTHTHIRTASFDLRGGYTPINLPREYHCGFRALSALLASDLLCLRCPSTSVNNSSRGPRVAFPHSRSGQAAGPARLLVTNHVRHDAWRQPSVTGTSGENKRAGWKTREQGGKRKSVWKSQHRSDLRGPIGQTLGMRAGSAERTFRVRHAQGRRREKPRCHLTSGVSA